MAELSDSFKQLDTVGKLRYKEKLGMPCCTWSPGSTRWCGWQAENISISLDECCGEKFKQQLCKNNVYHPCMYSLIHCP